MNFSESSLYKANAICAVLIRGIGHERCARELINLKFKYRAQILCSLLLNSLGRKIISTFFSFGLKSWPEFKVINVFLFLITRDESKHM